MWMWKVDCLAITLTVDHVGVLCGLSLGKELVKFNKIKQVEARQAR